MNRFEQSRSSSERHDRRVKRRRILYISGFDPRGASFYHRMLEEEAAKHAARSGEPMQIGPRRIESPLVQAWTLTCGTPPESVETIYEFLRWDDIIRAHWPRSLPRVWADALWASWSFIRSGLYRASLRSSYPVAITMSLPGIFIVVQLLLIALVTWLFLGPLPRLSGLPWWSGIIPAIAALWGVVTLAQRLEAKFNIYWISRIMAFNVRDAYGRVEGIEGRRDALAAHFVAAVRRGEDDEVILVGHSLGTPLAVSVMARSIESDPNLGFHGPAVALLTLGPTTPLLSLIPAAEWFRRELRVLGSATIPWIEFSAPTDGACYALVDPVTLPNPGFRRPEGAGLSPKILNARFMQLIDVKTYAKVKRDWIRLHFQYLMAGDRLGDYNYFRIIGGRLRLVDRYAGRESVQDYSRLRLFAR
jgi:pimeloyl-ACP methyl ester carboxylesterase